MRNSTTPPKYPGLRARARPDAKRSHGSDAGATTPTKRSLGRGGTVTTPGVAASLRRGSVRSGVITQRSQAKPLIGLLVAEDDFSALGHIDYQAAPVRGEETDFREVRVMRERAPQISWPRTSRLPTATRQTNATSVDPGQVRRQSRFRLSNGELPVRIRPLGPRTNQGPP